ncbi:MULTISPECIES: winged helix-turn-helix domain-containing protein [Amycolatopsis]|uniref:HTH gntR-type domain-containing protein n=1 Tax=Amycolatopsis tucumanensis TaxID=401106 RepID=A0ABP7J1S8_9PSEU|nr:winged helix-turn-helix domain-containing protein [Amycolatopsis tucumanensis]MCF6422225.1 winged helix-turn-helix domain-containing protein [Amycolatopsis tucumanensis]
MALDRTEIAAQLRREITRGRYRPGDKLPSQRALAADLGAAPNTVGEALKILATEGLLLVRPKSGALVLDPAISGDESSDPVADARETLGALQVGIREVRSRLNALDRRVAEALERLPR